MTATQTGLHTRIARLAHLIEEAGPGLAAELRRLNPGAADRWRSAGFYRLYAGEIRADDYGSEDDQRRWAMILSGMAHLEHNRGLRPGVELARAGYAERRLSRLLSADDARLGDELRAAVAYLKARQGVGVDWVALARLVLSRPGSEGYDRCRRRIAEDYFRTMEQEHKQTKG